jgi:hypothetical protein
MVIEYFPVGSLMLFILPEVFLDGVALLAAAGASGSPTLESG